MSVPPTVPIPITRTVTFGGNCPIRTPSLSTAGSRGESGDSMYALSRAMRAQKPNTPPALR